MTTETLIIYGGDLVEWRLASGYTEKLPMPISPEKLKIEFNNAPKAMRVYHKPNGTLLWHKNSAGTSKIINGKTSEADFTAQPTTTYSIEGTVSDPSGYYLPRAFSFILGNTREHVIKLYHSSLGARFGQAGGIYGNTVFEDGKIASWALINLVVAPSLGPTLNFVALTDEHGEFRLPLDRLPAITKDAPSSKYKAKLEVKASITANPEIALDPETLAAVKVANGKAGDSTSQFADFFTFDVTPGKVAKVVSPEHFQIVLKST